MLGSLNHGYGRRDDVAAIVRVIDMTPKPHRLAHRRMAPFGLLLSEGGGCRLKDEATAAAQSKALRDITAQSSSSADSISVQFFVRRAPLARIAYGWNRPSPDSS
jgi:hypothetical protein